MKFKLWVPETVPEAEPGPRLMNPNIVSGGGFMVHGSEIINYAGSRQSNQSSS